MMLEREEDYKTYRDELSTLYLNLAMLKPLHHSLLSSIAQLLQTVNIPQMHVNDAEVPLFLIYSLQQSITGKEKEFKQPNVEQSPYYQIIAYMVKLDFLAYQNKITTMMFLENMVRYYTFF